MSRRSRDRRTVQISVNQHRHIKFRGIGGNAIALWHGCLQHSKDAKADGFVASCVPRVVCAYAGIKRAKPAINALVKNGLWIEVEGGWQMHGYLDHQTSAADDEAKRAAWAQRARQRAIPSSQRRAVFERDDWACRNCGAGENLEIDHIYPVARGGDNALDNLQVLCSPCNRSKGSSVPGERY